MILHRIARPLVLWICRVLWRVKVVGKEYVPATGAYILTPTHRSNLDTPFTAFVTPRRIWFVAKRELFKNAFGAKVFTALGGIPVDRGSASARSALKAVQVALEAGEPAAVFPEGTRRHGPEITDLFDGAAYLAVKLGVPLVPVGIGGSEAILASGKKVPTLHKVVVVIGEPIEPPAGATTRHRGDLVALTNQLQITLQKLFDEAQALAN